VVDGSDTPAASSKGGSVSVDPKHTAVVGMLENTRALVDAARAAGATVVHGVVDSTAFVQGEWGAEIVDSLSPQPGDLVVEGKRGLDTFATTNLDFILRARGITTIALGGDLDRGARQRHPLRLPDVL
jgi:nicotinamidase-related amidase